MSPVNITPVRGEGPLCLCTATLALFGLLWLGMEGSLRAGSGHESASLLAQSGYCLNEVG
jgi:hypothetical protein